MTDPAARHSLRVHQFHGLRRGPRLLVLGAVHGNEVAGMLGIQRVLSELDRGELRITRGCATFVPVTNPLAHELGRRMGDRNLNRNLRPSAVPQDFEDRIANVLCPLLDAHEVLLDLHSFQGQGEAFVMIGPLDNRGDLEPFAHAADEDQAARREEGVARAGVRRPQHGTGREIERRQARDHQRVDAPFIHGEANLQRALGRPAPEVLARRRLEPEHLAPERDDDRAGSGGCFSVRHRAMVPVATAQTVGSSGMALSPSDVEAWLSRGARASSPPGPCRT